MIIMELKDFIKDFADQFDETDASEFNADTVYREIDEWASIIGFAVLNMVAKKYGVKITPVELRGTKTVGDLYKLVQSKQMEQ